MEAIAARLGLDVHGTGKAMARLRKEHPDLPARGAAPPVPYGMTKQTENMRYWLGVMVGRLYSKHSKKEVTSMIGLTRADQKKATETKPHAVDWSLTQMERLAAAHGITFDKLLDMVARPQPKIGFE